MLPQEQTAQIKEQIIQQIDSSFPEDKKEIAKKQIREMDDVQLEEFLKQNKLVKSDSVGAQQCVFCSIVSEQTQSYKIDEEKDAIAILEINPISQAHALVIPKEHISSSDKIPKNVFSFADKIAKNIKAKFKPKDVLISPSNLFGHEIINILPVYENETLDSKRHQAKPEELEEIKKMLETKPKKEVIKKPQTKKIEGKLWLPRRIP